MKKKEFFNCHLELEYAFAFKMFSIIYFLFLVYSTKKCSLINKILYKNQQNVSTKNLYRLQQTNLDPKIGSFKQNVYWNQPNAVKKAIFLNEDKLFSGSAVQPKWLIIVSLNINLSIWYWMRVIWLNSICFSVYIC